jgi:hypothetical protein
MVFIKLTLNILQMQGNKVNQVNKFQVCQAYPPKRGEGGLVKLKVYKVYKRLCSCTVCGSNYTYLSEVNI